MSLSSLYPIVWRITDLTLSIRHESRQPCCTFIVYMPRINNQAVVGNRALRFSAIFVSYRTYRRGIAAGIAIWAIVVSDLGGIKQWRIPREKTYSATLCEVVTKCQDCRLLTWWETDIDRAGSPVTQSCKLGYYLCLVKSHSHYPHSAAKKY